jgi:hypothetical protein
MQLCMYITLYLYIVCERSKTSFIVIIILESYKKTKQLVTQRANLPKFRVETTTDSYSFI